MPSVADLRISEHPHSRQSSFTSQDGSDIYDRAPSRMSIQSNYTTTSRKVNRGDMYSQYNESMTTLRADEQQQFNRNLHSSLSRRGTASRRSCVEDFDDIEPVGPPPVPPPHSVNIVSSPDPANRASQRTPSPLRNAMDDVLTSLDIMQLRTPSQSPVKSMLEDTTPNPGLCTPMSFSSSPRKTPSQHWSTLQSPIRALSSSPTKKSRSQFPHRPSDFSEISLPPHEDDTPFDANSFSTSPSRNGSYIRQNGGNSLNASTSSSNNESTVSRQDTFRTMSSVATSLSSVSDMPSPSIRSNYSMNSGSSIRGRGKTGYYKDNHNNGSIDNESFYDKPAKLPGMNSNANLQKSTGSLTLKKSSGFLKKFFSPNSNSNNARTSSASPEKGRLRPRKSAKSFMSTTSRPLSSLSIRETLKKVSRVSNSRAKSSLDAYPSDNETSGWMAFHQNAYRTNSLSGHEKRQRQSREQVDGLQSIEPIEQLSRIGGNETYDGSFTWNDNHLQQLSKRDFSVVDNAILNINSWPYLTPHELARVHMLNKYSDPIEQLRAAFNFCSTKLKWESLLVDDDYEEGVGSLSRVMQSRRANSLEIAYIFQAICDTLEITCEVIPGYLKGPGEVWHNGGIPRPNHYWNAVLVDGLWRMVDASLASPTFPTRDTYTVCDQRKPEYFYFLTRPCELVFTHVPYSVTHEHIVPSLSHEVLNALPLAGPLAFKYNLTLKDFSTSLTRLKDLDIAELILAVPPEVELYAEVVTGTFPAGAAARPPSDVEDRVRHPALVQPYWEDNERFYRVKALLPPQHTQGALNIYVERRGAIKSISHTTFALAYSMPIVQAGENPLLNFATRYPTPGARDQDIYIREPQCRDLVYGRTYPFTVRQHSITRRASNGHKMKMALQSPSGKIIKLRNIDSTNKGLFEGAVKVSERGNWRGLVLADDGHTWCVYGGWECT